MTPDEEIVAIKRATFEKFKDAPNVWIVEDYGAGFMLHAWTPDGVAPATSYPSKRGIASRLLQLLAGTPAAQIHHSHHVERFRRAEMSIEVRTSYPYTGGFERDSAAEHAAGRAPDFSGAGFGERDLGWVCKSEIEAERIKRALNKIGMIAVTQY